MQGTIQTLLGASKGIQDSLQQYIKTGDVDFVRHAVNHMMIIKAMTTKRWFSKFMVCGVFNEHPLSDEERKQLAKELGI